MKLLSAWVCGWLFAVGLGVAGMTQPSRVIAFLDIFGDWNPSLMFVMGGAVLVGLILFPTALRRPHPLFNERFYLPEKLTIDSRLLAGASIFGVGWGMSGFCPGPALVSMVTLNPSVWVFVLAMLTGQALGRWFTRDN